MGQAIHESATARHDNAKKRAKAARRGCKPSNSSSTALHELGNKTAVFTYKPPAFPLCKRLSDGLTGV